MAKEIEKTETEMKEPKAPKERTKKSDVWQHFKLIDRAGGKRAQCDHCLKDYKFTSNTSTLLMHLRTKHEDIYTPQDSGINCLIKKNREACYDISELVCKQGLAFRCISMSRVIKTYLFEKYGIVVRSPNTVRQYVMCFGKFVVDNQKSYIMKAKKKNEKFYLLADELTLPNKMKILGLKLKIISKFLIDLGAIKIDECKNEIEILDSVKKKLNIYGLDLDDCVFYISDACQILKSIAHLLDALQQKQHFQIYKALTEPTYQCPDGTLLHDMFKIYRKLILKPNPNTQTFTTNDETEDETDDEHDSSSHLLTSSQFLEIELTMLDSNESVNPVKEKILTDYNLFKSSGILSDSLHQILEFINEIPATSVPIEKMFSVPNFVQCKERNRIDGLMLNYLLILKSYFSQNDLIFHTVPKEPY